MLLQVLLRLSVSGQTRSVVVKALFGLLVLAPDLAYCAWTWTTPVSTVGNGIEPQVVTDKAANATLIWRGTTSGIQSSRYEKGAWNTPVTITNSTGISQAQAVVDGSGVVIAIWQRHTGSDTVIESSRLVDNAWSAPRLLSAASGDATNPHLAALPGGGAIVLWEKHAGANSLIEETRWNGTGWNPAVGISTAGKYAQNPQVAVFGNGEAIAIWQEFLAGPNAASTESSIQASFFDRTSWTAPVAISGATGHAQTPRLAISGNQAFALWQQDDGNSGWMMISARFNAGSWSAPTAISPANDFAKNPRLVGNKKGNVIALWERNDGSQWSIRSSSFSNDAWSVPSVLSAPGYDHQEPRLVLDENGAALVIWQKDDGNNDRVQTIRYDNGKWSVQDDLTPPGDNAQAPQIGLSNPNEVHVAWQKQVGNDWRIESRLGVIGYLRGLAAQGFIGTNNQVQFGAFSILGSPRKVLIRGLGPTLDKYIPGAVRNPQIALSFNGAASPLITNDDWKNADNADEISQGKYAPANESESAILTTLQPGIYNVHLSGSGGTTGIGMFEVFAVDGDCCGYLRGLAAQGMVGTDNQVQFGAFTISGAPRKVLIRGLGPTLDKYIPGAVRNPQIALSFNGAASPLITNDDWKNADNADEISQGKYAPANESESAILTTLQPGIYNVHLSGSGGTTGIGMFEVFVLE